MINFRGLGNCISDPALMAQGVDTCTALDSNGNVIENISDSYSDGVVDSPGTAGRGPLPFGMTSKGINISGVGLILGVSFLLFFVAAQKGR